MPARAFFNSLTAAGHGTGFPFFQRPMLSESASSIQRFPKNGYLFPQQPSLLLLISEKANLWIRVFELKGFIQSLQQHHRRRRGPGTYTFAKTSGNYFMLSISATESPVAIAIFRTSSPI